MIFYLSGTGNTRWVAQQISEATGEELIDVARVMAETRDGAPLKPFVLKPDERVGLCFPVHGWRPPRLFIWWLTHRTVDMQGHYVYAVCTAGDTIGKTIEFLQAHLAYQDVQLDAAASLIMPESYVGLPFMDVDTPEREQQKIKAAGEKLQKIIPDIVARRPIQEKLDIGRWPWINTYLLGTVFKWKWVNDRRYHVDADRCTRCGICADVCPVGDIDGGRGKMPQWKHHQFCMACMTCYHHCPRHAIQCGRQTKNKGQYFFKGYR